MRPTFVFTFIVTVEIEGEATKPGEYEVEIETKVMGDTIIRARAEARRMLTLVGVKHISEIRLINVSDQHAI